MNAGRRRKNGGRSVKMTDALKLWLGAGRARGRASPGTAQSAYPDRPITMIVPFAAGGPSDVLGRHVVEAMSKNLNQRIVVENVGGAGGTIGSTRGARAPPDGYTILLGHTGTHAANVGLYKKLPYDAVQDFEPIGSVGDQPQFLVVKKSLPIKNFKEFADYPKANKMTYGTAGVGSATHLGGLLLNAALGTDATPVVYRSVRPGDDRPDRRPHRFPDRRVVDRAAADPRRHGDAGRGAALRSGCRRRRPFPARSISACRRSTPASGPCSWRRAARRGRSSTS